jgi:hypothetical protein
LIYEDSSRDVGTKQQVSKANFNMNTSRQQEDGGTAPAYPIPRRRLGALEHPMIIKDLDKGIKTFGQNNALQAVCPRLTFQ